MSWRCSQCDCKYYDFEYKKEHYPNEDTLRDGDEFVDPISVNGMNWCEGCFNGRKSLCDECSCIKTYHSYDSRTCKDSRFCFSCQSKYYHLFCYNRDSNYESFEEHEEANKECLCEGQWLLRKDYGVRIPGIQGLSPPEIYCCPLCKLKGPNMKYFHNCKYCDLLIPISYETQYCLRCNQKNKCKTCDRKCDNLNEICFHCRFISDHPQYRQK